MIGKLNIDYSKVKPDVIQVALMACLEIQLNGLTKDAAYYSISALCEASDMEWVDIEKRLEKGN